MNAKLDCFKVLKKFRRQMEFLGNIHSGERFQSLLGFFLPNAVLRSGDK